MSSIWTIPKYGQLKKNYLGGWGGEVVCMTAEREKQKRKIKKEKERNEEKINMNKQNTVNDSYYKENY